MNKYYLTGNIQFPDIYSTDLIRKYVRLIFSIKLLCNDAEGHASSPKSFTKVSSTVFWIYLSLGGAAVFEVVANWINTASTTG